MGIGPGFRFGFRFGVWILGRLEDGLVVDDWGWGWVDDFENIVKIPHPGLEPGSAG